MNFLDSGAEGHDQVRKRIQQHKNEFNAVRRELRKLQQEYERQHLSERSTDDIEMQEVNGKVQNQMLRQRGMLEEAKRAGYECEDMATDIKVNLKGQRERMESGTLKSLYDI